MLVCVFPWALHAEVQRPVSLGIPSMGALYTAIVDAVVPAVVGFLMALYAPHCIYAVAASTTSIAVPAVTVAAALNVVVAHMVRLHVPSATAAWAVWLAAPLSVVALRARASRWTAALVFLGEDLLRSATLSDPQNDVSWRVAQDSLVRCVPILAVHAWALAAAGAAVAVVDAPQPINVVAVPSTARMVAAGAAVVAAEATVVVTVWAPAPVVTATWAVRAAALTSTATFIARGLMWTRTAATAALTT